MEMLVRRLWHLGWRHTLDTVIVGSVGSNVNRALQGADLNYTSCTGILIQQPALSEVIFQMRTPVIGHLLAILIVAKGFDTCNA